MNDVLIFLDQCFAILTLQQSQSNKAVIKKDF